MKPNELLKYSSGIMIWVTIIRLVLMIIPYLYLTDTQGIVIFSLVFISLNTVFRLFASIMGLKYASIPEKATFCVVLGVLLIVIQIISDILLFAAGGKLTLFLILIDLVLPFLYLIGAGQNKDLLNE